MLRRHPEENADLIEKFAKQKEYKKKRIARSKAIKKALERKRDREEHLIILPGSFEMGKRR